MLKRFLSLFIVLCIASTTALATDNFVVFEPQSDAISISNASIGYSQQEYEGVKIAIANLQNDMLNVMGKAPQLREGSADVTILVGTIGKNTTIDKLKLPDLKGKREKFIITTVDIWHL